MKRKINSHTTVSQLKLSIPLFDHLGLLHCILQEQKVLMQDVWVSGIDRDKELHKEYRDSALKWFQDLNKLPHIKVPRCLVPSGESLSHYMFSPMHDKRHMVLWYMQDVFKPTGK